MSYSSKIQAIRKEQGITQEELAGRAEVAVRTISRIEQETMKPSINIMEKIAKALDVSIDFLVADEGRTKRDTETIARIYELIKDMPEKKLKAIEQMVREIGEV